MQPGRLDGPWPLLFILNKKCPVRFTIEYRKNASEKAFSCVLENQARRQLNWNGGGGMDSQYKLLSELLSDQAAFIASPKTSLANYWGGAFPPAPQCLRACREPNTKISPPPSTKEAPRGDTINTKVLALSL